MDINVYEFDSIMNIVSKMIDAFAGVTDYLGTSVNDILPIALPSWLGGNLTPLALILGVGLPVYIGHQFLVWVGNVIT